MLNSSNPTFFCTFAIILSKISDDLANNINLLIKITNMIFFKNILSAKARIITYLSILSLILVLGLQVYVVYDYFRLTRYALSKEINRAFDEACEKEVSLRFKSLFSFKGSSPKMKVSTSSKDKDVVVYDFAGVRSPVSVSMMTRR